MKIVATIKEVRSIQLSWKRHLRIEASGAISGAGEYADVVEVTFHAPDNERNQRAFFVGRKVSVEITPTGGAA